MASIFSDSDQQFGIVAITVANMRIYPFFQSEMVNQVLLGTIVSVFEEQNDFYYVENWDGYRGWLSRPSLEIVDASGADQWLKQGLILFDQNYGVVRREPNQTAEVLTDLVPGARLGYVSEKPGFTEVKMPDGRSGFIGNGTYLRHSEQSALTADRDAIIERARRYLGIPYLWGGSSAKGFDCSGLVQEVFRHFNISLPRNASQMARIGTEVPLLSLDNLQMCDLLFFGKSLQRITHVAIYIADGLYIHASGRVRQNSLDPHHPDYDAARHQYLIKAVRVL